MTNKHTPGPWKLDGHTVIATAKALSKIKIVQLASNWTADDELDANARLIAAAPDLLAALEEMTMCYALLDARLVGGQHKEPNGTIERARTALSKAKGQ